MQSCCRVYISSLHQLLYMKVTRLRLQCVDAIQFICQINLLNCWTCIILFNYDIVYGNDQIETK